MTGSLDRGSAAAMVAPLINACKLSSTFSAMRSSTFSAMRACAPPGAASCCDAGAATSGDVATAAEAGGVAHLHTPLVVS